MALIALQRAKRRGLVAGRELDSRLRLGIEMLLDRACPQGGWNAGNAVVYGVPLRPHVDTTALALAALRFHHNLPTVHSCLTWLIRNVECPSPHNLAWLRKPQIGGRRRTRCAQDIVECSCRPLAPRQREEVKVVADRVIRQVECANSQGTFWHVRAHEILFAPIGPWWCDAPDAAGRRER
jgi:hypothetical protein